MKWWQRGWSELASERTKAVRLKVKPFGVPYGIEVLKVFLLFQAVLGTLFLLLSFNPRIHSLHSAYFTFVIYHERTTQLLSTITIFFLLAWFYALHQRLPIAWIVGWVVISGGFLAVAVGSVQASLSQIPDRSRWVAACLVGLASLAGAVHVGRLWNDQKYFFRRKDS